MLTLKERLSALKYIDNGKNVSKLATEMNVGTAIIFYWKKKQGKLEQSCATSLGKNTRNLEDF